MFEFHTIWLVVFHYGYEAVVEFVIDIGDHYMTHVVFVWVLKAGAVHGVVVAANRIRKHRANKRETD